MVAPPAENPVSRSAAPLEITVTHTGQAWVDQQPVTVPPGTDPRAAAAQVAITRARRQGVDLRAVLIGPGPGERHRMLFTAKGQVLWEEARARDTSAQSDEDPYAGLPPPEPREDIDPATIPAWPHFNIVITE
jgi:hypothetical protein